MSPLLVGPSSSHSTPWPPRAGHQWFPQTPLRSLTCTWCRRSNGSGNSCLSVGTSVRPSQYKTMGWPWAKSGRHDEWRGDIQSCDKWLGLMDGWWRRMNVLVEMSPSPSCRRHASHAGTALASAPPAAESWAAPLG